MPKMERLIKTTTLTFLATFLLLLLPNTYAHHLLLPHCMNQFSLASYACAMLPYTPFPHPSPPSPAPSPPSPSPAPPSPSPTPCPPPPSPSLDVEHEHREMIHKENHHGSIEENCCKWLGALDKECVCGLLHRLPVFLSKPAHQYTLYVSNSCNITYACDGWALWWASDRREFIYLCIRHFTFCLF